MPNARTHSRKQQQFDFQLPDDQQERRQRMTALRHHWFMLIEAIEHADCDLTIGRRRRVVAFLKRWLKSDQSDWHGIGTVCQSRLANDWVVNRQTIANYLKWAKSIGAVDWSIDADQGGLRRTTIEISFAGIAKLVGMSAMPDQDPQSSDDQSQTVWLCSETEQSQTVSDQSQTVSDQSQTVSDQSQTVWLHPPIGKDRLPPDDWAAVENLFKDVGVILFEDLAREAAQLEYSPVECVEIVKTFKANRHRFSSSGAITFRIRRGEWPADGVKEARVLQEAATKKAAAIQAAREDEQQRRAEADSARTELAALEEVYGPELDSLDEDDRLRFVRSVLREQFTFDLYRRNPHDSYVRHQLLAAIHENRAEVEV
jgi:hypothetical protein